MAFHSIYDFFSMGGYAFYVWWSYGITFIAFFILLLNSLHQKKKTLKKVQRRILREQRAHKNKQVHSKQ